MTNDKLLASLVGGSGIPVKRHGISGLPTSGDIPVPGLPIAGSHGYTFGGNVSENVIQEQEHGTETTGEQRADLIANNQRGSNAQTSTVIVCMGGDTGSGLIQEYTIGTDDDSLDKGDLADAPNQTWTHCYSSTHAYTMGGWIGSATTDIEEYEFGTATGGSNKSSLYTGIAVNAGGTDGTYSYSYCGSLTAGTNVNYIVEYELGTGTQAGNVADATLAKRAIATTQNTTLLICNGGYSTTEVSVIEEFTMQSGENATAKADLDTANYAMSATQSTTHGYTAGGGGAGAGAIIEQYEFGTGTDSIAKGDLLQGNQNSFSGGSGTP